MVRACQPCRPPPAPIPDKKAEWIRGVLGELEARAWSPWPIRATREARTRKSRTGGRTSRNLRNANRAHAKLRSPGERANAQLKTGSRSGASSAVPLLSTGRQATAAEGTLTEPPGPTARAAPQFTDRAADGEHRSHLCPEPGRPAHARRSARRCYPAVPQRRPQPVGRGSHRPAAPPGRRPRHSPSLPAVAANSFVVGGNPRYAHPAILTHRTGPG